MSERTDIRIHSCIRKTCGLKVVCSTMAAKSDEKLLSTWIIHREKFAVWKFSHLPLAWAPKWNFISNSYFYICETCEMSASFMLCATCHENKILFRAASGQKSCSPGIFSDKVLMDASIIKRLMVRRWIYQRVGGTLDRLKVHQTLPALWILRRKKSFEAYVVRKIIVRISESTKRCNCLSYGVHR